MLTPSGGFTLVELIVALAVLGVALGVSSLAVGTWDTTSDRGSQPVRATQARSIRDGSIEVVPLAGERGPTLLLPDGRVLGAQADSTGAEQ